MYVACFGSSFLLLSSMPLNGYTSLSVPQVWTFDGFQFLVIVNKTINIQVQGKFFKDLNSMKFLTPYTT